MTLTSIEAAAETPEWKVTTEANFSLEKNPQPYKNQVVIDTRWIFKTKEQGTKKARLVRICPCPPGKYQMKRKHLLQFSWIICILRRVQNGTVMVKT